MSAVNDNLPTLLVVEDEKNTREGLRRYFDGKFDIYLAPTWRRDECPRDAARRRAPHRPAADGREEGLDMLTRSQSIAHPPVAILMTAYGSEKVAVQAMNGALTITSPSRSISKSSTRC